MWVMLHHKLHRVRTHAIVIQATHIMHNTHIHTHTHVTHTPDTHTLTRSPAHASLEHLSVCCVIFATFLMACGDILALESDRVAAAPDTRYPYSPLPLCSLALPLSLWLSLSLSLSCALFCVRTQNYLEKCQEMSALALRLSSCCCHCVVLVAVLSLQQFRRKTVTRLPATPPSTRLLMRAVVDKLQNIAPAILNVA